MWGEIIGVIGNWYFSLPNWILILAGSISLVLIGIATFWSLRPEQDVNKEEK